MHYNSTVTLQPTPLLLSATGEERDHMSPAVGGGRRSRRGTRRERRKEDTCVLPPLRGVQLRKGEENSPLQWPPHRRVQRGRSSPFLLHLQHMRTAANKRHQQWASARGRNLSGFIHHYIHSAAVIAMQGHGDGALRHLPRSPAKGGHIHLSRFLLFFNAATCFLLL